MSTHTLVILMVTIVFTVLIGAGLIADRRKHRRPPASKPPGSEQ